MCVCLKKSPYLATNTHKMVKQGLAKENKFNTILCIGKSAIGSKKSQPKATTAQRFFAPEGGPDCALWTAQSFALRSP